MAVPLNDDSTLEDAVLTVLANAKELARQYRLLTGKPLGITGEVAEYEAAKLLRVKLSPARNEGFDAIENIDGTERRLQIKGRCVLQPRRLGMVGKLDLDKDWDAALLVLLNADFDAIEIYEADRAAIEAALLAPGSRGRNERWTLAVSKFKSIGDRRWPAMGSRLGQLTSGNQS